MASRALCEAHCGVFLSFHPFFPGQIVLCVIMGAPFISEGGMIFCMCNFGSLVQLIYRSGIKWRFRLFVITVFKMINVTELL